MAIVRKVKIDLLPAELAKEFMSMSCHNKAVFFNCLHNDNPGWEKGFLEDMDDVSKSNCLQDGGMDAIGIIGRSFHVMNLGKSK